MASKASTMAMIRAKRGISSPFKPWGYPPAVETLMVGEDTFGYGEKLGGSLGDAVANLGVFFHFFPFFFREQPGLGENGTGNT